MVILVKALGLLVAGYPIYLDPLIHIVHLLISYLVAEYIKVIRREKSEIQVNSLYCS